MGLLDDLTGGGDRQADFQDFIGRYDQGAPYDNVDGQEAFDRHQQLAGELSPDDYEQSAQDALQRMSPEDRMAFGNDLEAQANANGLDLGSLLGGLGGGLGGLGNGGLGALAGQNPGMLAGLLGQMHRQDPSMLGGLMGGLGGGAGGLLSGGSKGALAGIAAMAASRLMQ